MERYFILEKFNTWYDWRLILTAKSITPPETKTNYIELDGMSGSLDLSEALSGEPTYKDRTITASFWTDAGSFKDRDALLKEIITTLHGKKIKIIEPDDPDHYYVGRIKITSKTNVLPYAEFAIEATCEPWRYALEDTVRLVEVDDTIPPVDVVFRNSGVKTICPTMIVDGNITVSYNGVDYSLNTGSYKISDIKIRQGITIIRVSGDGSVNFMYKEADL